MTATLERIHELSTASESEYRRLLIDAAGGGEVDPDDLWELAHRHGDTADHLQQRIEILEEQQRLQNAVGEVAAPASWRKDYLKAAQAQKDAKVRLGGAEQAAREATDLVQRLLGLQSTAKAESNRLQREADKHRRDNFDGTVVDPLEIKQSSLV